MAHTLVSKLGKILSITFFPLSSLKLNVDKSLFTKVNSGALSPTLTKLPTKLTGFPLNFVFITLSFINFEL